MCNETNTSTNQTDTNPLEAKMMETSIRIIRSNENLSNRSASQRKNWAEGFYNGVLYALESVKKKSNIQKEIWECDHASTGDEKSRGIVTGIKFVLDDIKGIEGLK